MFGDRRGFKPAQLKTNKQTNDHVQGILEDIQNLEYTRFGEDSSLDTLAYEVTKILRNSLFAFLLFLFSSCLAKCKNRTHGNENLATYFWYFGSFDEKNELTKMT